MTDARDTNGMSAEESLAALDLVAQALVAQQGAAYDAASHDVAAPPAGGGEPFSGEDTESAEASASVFATTEEPAEIEPAPDFVARLEAALDDMRTTINRDLESMGQPKLAEPPFGAPVGRPLAAPLSRPLVVDEAALARDLEGWTRRYGEEPPTAAFAEVEVPAPRLRAASAPRMPQRALRKPAAEDGPPNRLRWSEASRHLPPISDKPAGTRSSAASGPKQAGVFVFDPVERTDQSRGMILRVGAVTVVVALVAGAVMFLSRPDWSASARETFAQAFDRLGLARVESEVARAAGEVATFVAASTAAKPAAPAPAPKAEPAAAPAAPVATLGASGPMPAAAPQPAAPLPSAPPPVVQASMSAQPALATQPRRTWTAAEVEALLAKGGELMEKGDVAGARLVFQHALASGDPRAMMAMGGTYDPVVFRRIGVKGIVADPERARRYYEEAWRAGANGAEVALAQLDQGDARR